jgi:hypothetical protein
MTNKSDSGNTPMASAATMGSIIIIIIIVMVTVNTTLNYSGPLANASSSAVTSTSAQTSSIALLPPVIDGQSESPPGVCQPSLSTSKANDLLVLFVGGQDSGPLVSVSDSAGLAWHHRASAQYNYSTTTFETVEEWYAMSASPLSRDNLTVKATRSGGDFHCLVLGVAGVNPTTPFDPSAGCSPDTAVPRSAASNSGTVNATVTICTSNGSDLLVAALWARGNYAISTFPVNFVFLAGGGDNSFNEAYEQVSAIQTNLPVTWTFYGGADSWGVIGDAIRS